MPVHWMKTPDCFLKCAYWWLRQTYWSGCMGKGAQEALEKTALALRWWRERPPTGRPPGPAPLRGHSTCTSHQQAAGSSAVQAASPEVCSLEWEAAFTVIGLVAQLLNDSQVSAHSVKSIDVQTFKTNKCFLSQLKRIHRIFILLVSSRKYLFFPPLWYIFPQTVGPWSSLVHTVWPNGSQTHCLWGEKKIWRIMSLEEE